MRVRPRRLETGDLDPRGRCAKTEIQNEVRLPAVMVKIAQININRAIVAKAHIRSAQRSGKAIGAISPAAISRLFGS
jgi:hypothetical protein